MASDHRRSSRVAEGVREIVASFLAEHARDPRFEGLVTVTGVDVTRDLRQARIHVSIMGDDAARVTTFSALQSVAPQLRSSVGRELRLRHAPELVFGLDDSIAHAARIESLLAQVRSADSSDAADEGDSGAAPADGAESGEASRGSDPDADVDT